MSTVLDKLPEVPNNIFGVELKICVIVIACLSIAHFFCFGACPFDPVSIATSIISAFIFFVLSILLLLAALEVMNAKPTVIIWIWYTLFFVGIQVLSLIVIMIVSIVERDTYALVLVILGFLWYALLFYFILVVNQYRKSLKV